MKLVVTKASDDYYTGFVDFYDIKELFDFIDQCGHDVVVSDRVDYLMNFDGNQYTMPGLIIYDDYLE